MQYLYLLLNLASISIPFIASFHPRLKFYKKWRSLFFAISMTTVFFIVWDVLFTMKGNWGFNPAYYLGITIANLPIEEWLFFICIPYACVFMHYALLELFPSINVSSALTNTISRILQFVCIILCIVFYDRDYTLVNYLYAVIVIEIALRHFKTDYSKFLVTFLPMLIPFFLVNGVLTGSWIDDQVVWYNDQENLGIRIGTIPVEDAMYAFTMVLTNLMWLIYFERRKNL